MLPTHRFLQLTDLHLSGRADTPTAVALRWAVEQINRTPADFLIASGDVTSWGDAESTRLFIAAIDRIRMPVYFTPGNAEHRSAEAMPLLNARFEKTPRFVCHKDLLFLFPDTSHGALSAETCVEMNAIVARHPARKGTVVVTHYPVDALQADSRDALANWLGENEVDLLVAGHKHIHRRRRIGSTEEIVTRGLDPDKASGDLPGISLFERAANGNWTETFMPWAFPVALLPCDGTIPSPVGWSIHGDPITTVRETREFGLHALELRPKDLSFSTRQLHRELEALRAERPIYLSWHLPPLSWKEDLVGEDVLRAHLAIARDVGVDHLTVHVPQSPALAMRDSAVRQRFEDAFDRLFRSAVGDGVRLAIENVHNAPGVRAAHPDCKFATDPATYLNWIDTIQNRFSDMPGAQVGAHLDVGHARNNGDFGNQHPLADWYAQIGPHILGYHIHQIAPDPQTGKAQNHREIHTPFDLRISYAGFIHAWSARQINRAPLFVEIRDPDERRRSVRRLQHLFDLAPAIASSLDLPGRKK